MNVQNNIGEWVEEEITIADLMDRFFGINDISSPEIYDVNGKIEIMGRDLKSELDVYKPIKRIFVKDEVEEYYTDGHLCASFNHNLIENQKEIPVQIHPDFKKISGKMNVVDFEVEDIHNYYANGRLNHNTVPGGKALPFACSVRIRLANLGKLKVKRNGLDEVIGMKCTAQVIKNRCGPGYRTAQFEIHYDSGIQDLSSWLNYMKLHGIITGDKSGYTFKRVSGEKVEFNTPKFVELMNTDETLKEEVYQAICNEYIMTYRNPNSKIIENVEETTDENDDITKDSVKEDE